MTTFKSKYTILSAGTRGRMSVDVPTNPVVPPYIPEEEEDAVNLVRLNAQQVVSFLRARHPVVREFVYSLATNLAHPGVSAVPQELEDGVLQECGADCLAVFRGETPGATAQNLEAVAHAVVFLFFNYPNFLPLVDENLGRLLTFLESNQEEETNLQQLQELTLILYEQVAQSYFSAGSFQTRVRAEVLIRVLHNFFGWLVWNALRDGRRQFYVPYGREWIQGYTVNDVEVDGDTVTFRDPGGTQHTLGPGNYETLLRVTPSPTFVLLEPVSTPERLSSESSTSMQE